MRLRALLWSSCFSVAMAVSALPAAAAPVHECVSPKPTAASYTWDFKSEANTIFKDVQSDAQQAMDHADNLQSFAGDNGLSWEAHAYQLEYLKNDINDIGAKLCRLETIRPTVRVEFCAEAASVFGQSKLFGLPLTNYMTGYEDLPLVVGTHRDVVHIANEACHRDTSRPASHARR